MEERFKVVFRNEEDAMSPNSISIGYTRNGFQTSFTSAMTRQEAQLYAESILAYLENTEPIKYLTPGELVDKVRKMYPNLQLDESREWDLAKDFQDAIKEVMEDRSDLLKANDPELFNFWLYVRPKTHPSEVSRGDIIRILDQTAKPVTEDNIDAMECILEVSIDEGADSYQLVMDNLRNYALTSIEG